MLQIPLPYLNAILAYPSSFSSPLNPPPSPQTVSPPLLPSSPPPLQSFPLTHAACLPSPFPPSLLISSYIPFHPFPFSRPFLFSLFSFFSPFPLPSFFPNPFLFPRFLFFFPFFYNPFLFPYYPRPLNPFFPFPTSQPLSPYHPCPPPPTLFTTLCTQIGILRFAILNCNVKCHHSDLQRARNQELKRLHFPMTRHTQVRN